MGNFTFWISLLLRLSLSPKFGLRPKISRKVKSFLPYDAMQAQPVPSCGVCLSVCVVSVTFIHSVKTNKHIFRAHSEYFHKLC